MIIRLLRKIVAFALGRRSENIKFFTNISRKRFFYVKSNMAKKQSLNQMESYHLYESVRITRKIKGEIAEVGVFKGDSAKTICLIKGDAPLHLFDTFEGQPEVSDVDTQFKKGDSSIREIFARRKLANYPNVFFYKGLFPETAEPIKNKQFSFVHLDVDLYQSTLECLRFFYPRMCIGGVILIHDYPSAFGVLKAVDEYFSKRPEPVINVTPKQALIVKTELIL